MNRDNSNDRIVYVSPNINNGGVLQFSIALATLTEGLADARLFLVDTIDESLYENIKERVYVYSRITSPRKTSPQIVDLTERIAALSPTAVIFTEDTAFMQIASFILMKKGIKTAVVVHDATPHPYRNVRFRQWIGEFMRKRWTKKTAKRRVRTILLSDNTERTFKKIYRVENTATLRLGAHVPNATPKKPAELTERDRGFLLFFGRINKYKGLDRLCRAYAATPEEFKAKNELIVAGSGRLSDVEAELIAAEPRIRLINRFIEDGEMINLFERCKAIVLPYIEASQSGVLPIAYNFGKPAIVSDLPGFIENVDEGKTAFVFRSEPELTDALQTVVEKADDMRADILEYFENNFNWKTNIQNLLNQL